MSKAVPSVLKSITLIDLYSPDSRVFTGMAIGTLRSMTAKDLKALLTSTDYAELLDVADRPMLLDWAERSRRSEKAKLSRISRTLWIAQLTKAGGNVKLATIQVLKDDSAHKIRTAGKREAAKIAAAKAEIAAAAKAAKATK